MLKKEQWIEFFGILITFGIFLNFIIPNKLIGFPMFMVFSIIFNVWLFV